MAGNVQTEYQCDLPTWNAFRSLLSNTSLFIEEKGVFGKDLLLDIKMEEHSPIGVWLAVDCKKTSKNIEYIRLEMNWAVRNVGSKPKMSLEIATIIEKLLYNAGATCKYNSVTDFVVNGGNKT